MTSRRPYWCPKTKKWWPCWFPRPILWELNSFLTQTLSFVPVNLHRCGGGGHPDPKIRGDPLPPKNFFRPLRASFWSKNKGGGAPGPLVPSPGSATRKYLFKALIILFFSFARNDICLLYPLFSKSIFCRLISSTNTLNS